MESRRYDYDDDDDDCYNCYDHNFDYDTALDYSHFALMDAINLVLL